MKKHAIAMLEAAVAPAIETVTALRGLDFGASSVSVDKEIGMIRNCAVITAGQTLTPATGTAFGVDAITLQQVCDLIASSPDGVKSRFKHPQIVNGNIADDMGTVVGRVKNPRIVGDCVRGDVMLGEYASTVPELGDVRTYLLGLAAENPDSLGLSVVMAWTPERGADGSVVARVSRVMACDFVGKPAANPNGLCAAAPTPQNNSVAVLATKTPEGSATPTRKAVRMDPKLKAHLVAMGMDPDASEDAALSFHAALSASRKGELSAKMEAPAACAALGAVTPAATATPAAAPVVDVVAQERTRVEQITALGAILKAPESLVRKQIVDNVDPTAARTAMLSAMAADTQPYNTVRVGSDANQVSMLSALPDAIAMRAGSTVKNPHERASKLAGLTLVDMGRQYLTMLGYQDAAYINKSAMSEILLSRGHRLSGLLKNPQVAMLAESVGDFPSLLLDAMNKTFRPLYLEAPKTWPLWVRKTSNPDFKNINRTALSESPSLVRRDAGGTINYVNVTDGKETYALAEYVGGIKLTRKAIINDDLDAFGRLPQLQSNACWRAEEEACYGILTANAALGVDNVALFHATHKNLVTAGGTTGAAPTVASVQAAETLMITQKGPKNAARLALRPKFLITPAALKTNTEQFLTSTQLFATAFPTSGAPATTGINNPYAGKLVPVWSPVLDDTSAVNWYMAADYRDGQVDTVEISFLDGEPEPVLRQETDFDSEDVKFAVRHTLAAKAIDFRGMVKNPGA